MGLSNYIPSSRIAQSGVCTSSTRPATPYEGQMIYETDTNRVLVYDNTAWVMIADTDQPPGLQLVGTFTANGTSRSLNCDNVFTSEYDNYKVVIKLAGVSNTNWLYFQFINTNGTLVTASYYSTSYSRDFTNGSTAVSANNTTGSVAVGYMANGTGNPTGAECTIYGPLLAEWTTINGLYSGVSSGVAYQGGDFYATCNPSPNTLRGIRFDNIAGTNMTGTVSIYGYRK